MFNSVFITLPVENVNRSIDFFTALGFKFNADFSDDHTCCMVLSESIYVMLGEHKKYLSLIDKPIADSKSSEVILSFGCDSQQQVMEIAGKAIELGARAVNEPEDLGFMFSWGFEDLDGHLWNLIWMNTDEAKG
jgi:predicted lactoylglutathione lyase